MSNELAGPISASLRLNNAALFEEMSQRWRAVGNTVSDLTDPRFESQTSRFRDERATAQPTGRCFKDQISKIKFINFLIFNPSLQRLISLEVQPNFCFANLLKPQDSAQNFLLIYIIMHYFDSGA